MQQWKTISATLLPAAVMAIAVIVSRGIVPTVSAQQIAAGAVPVVFAIGLVLSAAFRRSRTFLALLLLLLVEIAIQLASMAPRPATAMIVFHCIALLLPLNLVALSFVRERGIVTVAGVRRIVVVLLQAAAIVFIAWPGSARAADLLDYAIVQRRFTSWTALSQVAVAGFTIAIVVLLVRTAQRHRPFDSALLWSLVAVFVALHFTLLPSFHLYLATAGMIFVIGVLESSYAMAYRDELTELPSRRSFNEELLKLGNEYSIAMVDVDHFKKFNDSYGHEAGDQVLRSVAAKLAAVEGGGKAFRYGGEEFAIVFPGKTLDAAYLYAEHVRQTIANAPFSLRGIDRRKRRQAGKNGRGNVEVTVSVGLASADTGTTAEQVLKAADKALYRAKAAGRNCSVAVELG